MTKKDGHAAIRRSVRWITETAVLLALLITLQYVTKPLGQYVTGSCVNAVLAITVLYAGVGSGLTVALISPVFAFLLGIAPNLLTVPATMVGNTVYVLLLRFIRTDGRRLWSQIAGWIVSAVCKFAVLYLIVVEIFCGLAAETLMNAGVLKAPMLKTLPAMFSWPQLVTALAGGAVAMLVAPALKRALKK